MHLHQHQNIHHQFAPSSASPAGGSTIASSPCMPVNHTSTQRRPSSPTPRSSWQTEAIYFLLACSLSLGLPSSDFLSFSLPFPCLVRFSYFSFSFPVLLPCCFFLSSSLLPSTHRKRPREGRKREESTRGDYCVRDGGREGGRKEGMEEGRKRARSSVLNTKGSVGGIH